MSLQTLLIGLDGATFTVLDELMAGGVMPNLSRFMATGARANLRTIVPALTPPAWTSMVTGKTPGNHGIFDFFRLQSKEELHIRFFTSNDVGTSTLWSLANDHGLRVTSLNFPAMFPAPRIDGYVIPGWVPWRQLRLACWPEDLFDTLKRTVATFNPRELAMDMSLEERATEGCSNGAEYAPWIELHTRREKHWFDIFRSLNERNPSDFTAVLFDGVDKLQHLCWRFLRPQDGEQLIEDWEIQARELCFEYFRKLDDLIGRMCDLAGPEATVIIASDHGFQPSRDVFHVNAWLAANGYLKWNDNAKANTSKALLGVGQVARHTWELDWTVTTAFTATPTSNGIYIVVNRDGNSPGIHPADYDAFREKLVLQLREVRHPDSGAPVLANVWTREQIFSGPYGDVAPDLTLELADGGLVSILPSDNVMSRRPVVSGVHAPLGVFAANGPGIRKGAVLNELSILDVAPLVLSTLGIDVPADIQGKVPEELFESGIPARPRPARALSASASSQSASASTASMSEDDELMILEKLRELGYLE